MTAAMTTKGKGSRSAVAACSMASSICMAAELSVSVRLPCQCRTTFLMNVSSTCTTHHLKSTTCSPANALSHASYMSSPPARHTISSPSFAVLSMPFHTPSECFLHPHNTCSQAPSHAVLPMPYHMPHECLLYLHHTCHQSITSCQSYIT